MKHISKITVCCAAALAVASCVKEYPGDSPADRATLQVVGIALEKTPEGRRETRASEINNTFTFEPGDALSLFMRGTNYDEVVNRKVTYSKPGADAGTWGIGGDPIYLHSESAVVSLVHPYTAGATYSNIPFVTGAYRTAIDLLWKQQAVYYTESQARVEKMYHALARVKFILKRDDPADTNIPDRYIGTGAVTNVSIGNGTAAGTGVNAAVFTDGVLDLSFTAPASPVSGTTAGAVADAANFTLTTAGHTTDLLTLPIAALKQKLVTLNVTIDGGTLTTALPFAAPAATQWEAGKCYTYTVTVKSIGIEITASTVDPWSSGTGGGNKLETPASPTVKDYYYDDGSFAPAPLLAGKTPVGVIFWVNPDDSNNFKVVALDEKQTMWSDTQFNVGTGSYAGIRDETKDPYSPPCINGATNHAILASWIADATVNTTGKTIANFPAFDYCNGKNVDGQTGWYLPAMLELQYLYCSYAGGAAVAWNYNSRGPELDQTAVAAWNKLFTDAGKDSFKGYRHWSATEHMDKYSWVVSFPNNWATNNSKTELLATRCIKEIK